MKYKVIIRPGEVSGYVVECPAIPGCVSQGATIEEALENIKDAMKGCLAVLNKRAQRHKAKHKEEILAEVTVQMPKLPRDISGRQAVKAFQRAGWTIARTGLHIVLEKEGMRPTLSVPNHKVLDPGTLRTLIRHSGLTVEEFLKHLK